METKLMTIRDVAEYLQLTVQTIQRYVFKRRIPYHKVHRAVRFRQAEIDQWVDEGGLNSLLTGRPEADREGDLFAGLEAGDREAAGGEAGGEL